MKKIVLLAVPVVMVAGFLVFLLIQPSAQVDAPPELPVDVRSDAAVIASAPINAQPVPTTVDMSLPMPLGLKGDADKGRIFFMGNCFTCHGIKGDGEGPRAYFITPPPRNFLLESSRQRLNRPALFEAINKGRVGTNMPAWGRVLNNQEIADVAEFVFQDFISAPPGK